MSAKAETLLMVADSEHDADMLYAVGLFAPDPFIYLNGSGKPLVVINDIEYARARKALRHARVLPMARYASRLRAGGKPGTAMARVVKEILLEKRVRRVTVPESFPHGLARQLRDLKVKLRARPGPFFPQRVVKTRDEVKKLSAALMMAEVGMSEAVQVLRRSKVGRGGKLTHGGVPLTSEKVQAIINIAVIQAGGLASHTIVAGGRQGCDPHEVGHGPLKANEPIIIDIFPRSQRTGYFGDLTRTVVKGRASEAARRLHHAVAAAHRLTLESIADGVACDALHERILSHFTSQGHKTTRTTGRMEGFYHGLGHGIGLEIHEAPRIGSNSDDVLETGQVVAIEPGLYYPRIGGVRIEDMVLVEEDGCRNLTKFESVFEL